MKFGSGYVCKAISELVATALAMTFLRTYLEI